jgi:hypothetical protein
MSAVRRARESLVSADLPDTQFRGIFVGLSSVFCGSWRFSNNLSPLRETDEGL